MAQLLSGWKLLAMALCLVLCLAGALGEDGQAEFDGGLPLLTPPTVKKATRTTEDVWDENGYVMFCLCMGRFGNQVDHLLGTIAFAKAINRTLVVPPFISYGAAAQTTFVPFEDLFRFSVLRRYLKAITMENFFKKFPDRWPPGSRMGQCYNHDRSIKTCRHKEGNPFGPFWDHFGVNFDSFETYMHSHSSDPHTISQWQQKFPVSKVPVIALPGAPAEFPVATQNRNLQQYLRWNQKMTTQAQTFITQSLPRPFLGIHLRNGQDWSRACDGISSATPSYMGSPQCQRPGFVLSKEHCFPSDETVVSQVVQAAKKIEAKSLFIATDERPLLKEFRAAFKKAGMTVAIKKSETDNPYLDLAILGQADFFIGNCVSTFTSFAKRERDVSGRPSDFWALS